MNMLKDLMKEESKNLDKDHVRRYLVENHGDFVRGEVEVETHNIPIEIKDNVLNAYLELYNRLCVGKESLIKDRQDYMNYLV